MLVAVVLFVAAVGGDSAAAASAGFATFSDDRRASSDTAAPRDYNITNNEVTNVLSEDSCLTILGIIGKQLPALKQSLDGLSDALEHPAQSKMLAPIQDLVDYIANYIEFVQHLPPPNDTTLHIDKMATLIKNLIVQTRLTSDAAVIKSMQSILTRILSLNEYLLEHERHHHHGEDKASEDADGTAKLPDVEVDSSVANDFFHALANPSFEICTCDRCPDCCRCCPDCGELPAGAQAA